jgi:DNA-binding HxlR family transcriptional regulator
MIWGHKTMFHEFKESPEKVPSKMLSNRLKKLEAMGFISKQKGTVNKKSIYYLLEKRGFDTFPIMIEMAIFTTKHFFDHLGTTYTGDVKKRMLKDKLDYTKELISNYKQFVRLQTF